MNVAIIGTGRVGLVAGAGFADFGLNVCCVDSDERKISALEGGKVPFYEPGLQELVRKNQAASRLSFTTDLAEAVKKSLVLFIAVGTDEISPGKPDLTALFHVVKDIARVINEYKVLVIKSTVPVGTAAQVTSELEQLTKQPFDVISNLEFLREGSAIENFMRPDRVVLGGDSQRALAIIRDIYRPLYLVDTPFIISDHATAEMIKYAANAFLATKISFIDLPPVIGPPSMLVHTPLQPGGAERNPAVTAGSLPGLAAGSPTRCAGELCYTPAAIPQSTPSLPARCKRSLHSETRLETSR